MSATLGNEGTGSGMMAVGVGRGKEVDGSAAIIAIDIRGSSDQLRVRVISNTTPSSLILSCDLIS